MLITLCCLIKVFWGVYLFPFCLLSKLLLVKDYASPESIRNKVLILFYLKSGRFLASFKPRLWIRMSSLWNSLLKYRFKTPALPLDEYTDWEDSEGNPETMWKLIVLCIFQSWFYRRKYLILAWTYWAHWHYENCFSHWLSVWIL